MRFNSLLIIQGPKYSSFELSHNREEQDNNYKPVNGRTSNMLTIKVIIIFATYLHSGDTFSFTRSP